MAGGGAGAWCWSGCSCGHSVLLPNLGGSVVPQGVVHEAHHRNNPQSSTSQVSFSLITKRVSVQKPSNSLPSLSGGASSATSPVEGLSVRRERRRRSPELVAACPALLFGRGRSSATSRAACTSLLSWRCCATRLLRVTANRRLQAALSRSTSTRAAVCVSRTQLVSQQVVCGVRSEACWSLDTL